MIPRHRGLPTKARSSPRPPMWEPKDVPPAVCPCGPGPARRASGTHFCAGASRSWVGHPHRPSEGPHPVPLLHTWERDPEAKAPSPANHPQPGTDEGGDASASLACPGPPEADSKQARVSVLPSVWRELPSALRRALRRRAPLSRGLLPRTAGFPAPQPRPHSLGLPKMEVRIHHIRGRARGPAADKGQGRREP